MQFPTWCFGMPAMLKGFLDRMIMPGVAFDLSDPTRVKPMLGNIKRIVGIATYGRPRHMALWMGDPPRKIVRRYLRWFTGGKARTDYYALYHLNVANEASAPGFHGPGRAARCAGSERDWPRSLHVGRDLPDHGARHDLQRIGMSAPVPEHVGETLRPQAAAKSNASVRHREQTLTMRLGRVAIKSVDATT